MKNIEPVKNKVSPHLIESWNKMDLSELGKAREDLIKKIESLEKKGYIKSFKAMLENQRQTLESLDIIISDKEMQTELEEPTLQYLNAAAEAAEISNEAINKELAEEERLMLLKAEEERREHQEAEEERQEILRRNEIEKLRHEEAKERALNLLRASGGKLELSEAEVAKQLDIAENKVIPYLQKMISGEIDDMKIGDNYSHLISSHNKMPPLNAITHSNLEYKIIYPQKEGDCHKLEIRYVDSGGHDDEFFAHLNPQKLLNDNDIQEIIISNCFPLRSLYELFYSFLKIDENHVKKITLSERVGFLDLHVYKETAALFSKLFSINDSMILREGWDRILEYTISSSKSLKKIETEVGKILGVKDLAHIVSGYAQGTLVDPFEVCIQNDELLELYFPDVFKSFEEQHGEGDCNGVNIIGNYGSCPWCDSGYQSGGENY